MKTELNISFRASGRLAALILAFAIFAIKLNPASAADDAGTSERSAPLTPETPTAAGASETWMACQATLTGPQPEHLIEPGADELRQSKETFVSRVLALKIQMTGQTAGLIGRPYSIEDSVALIASRLPEGPALNFIDDWWARLGGLHVKYKDMAIAKIRLGYSIRFFDFRIRRSKAATILWSTRKIESEEDLDLLVDNTIDIFAESAFIPTRRHSVYLRSPELFLSGNLRTMKEKLIYKLLAMGEESAAPAPGRVRETISVLLNIMRTVLPFQFYLIRGLELNHRHVNAYSSGGAQALYHYLKYREGLALYARYALVHFTNFKFAVIGVFIALLGPTVWEARRYFENIAALETSSRNEAELARRLYESMRNPPEEVLKAVRKEVKKLPPQERRLMEEALEP